MKISYLTCVIWVLLKFAVHFCDSISFDGSFCGLMISQSVLMDKSMVTFPIIANQVVSVNFVPPSQIFYSLQGCFK